MSIRDDLRTYLLTKTAFTTLVGSGDDARVYPGFQPQGVTLPAVVLDTISDSPEHTTDGHCSLTVARLQVQCWGKTPDSAQAVAEQVRLAVDGYRGTWGSTTINQAFKLDGEDGEEPAADNEPRRRFSHTVDYEVAYFQTVPTL